MLVQLELQGRMGGVVNMQPRHELTEMQTSITKNIETDYIRRFRIKIKCYTLVIFLLYITKCIILLPTLYHEVPCNPANVSNIKEILQS